jgi:quinol monooxygenase YgiN
MSGVIVLSVFKPRPGKEAELEALVRDHAPRLRAIGLATERVPIIARTADGTVLEMFEWTSQAAIDEAHSHPDVLQLWSEFEACCWYDTPAQVVDLQRMFVSLQPIN